MCSRAFVALTTWITVLMATASPAHAGITAFWRQTTITPAAIANDPALANMQCWDLMTATTGDWATAAMRATLPVGSTFYKHPVGGRTRPDPAQFTSFPALEFTTYVTSPSDDGTNNTTMLFGGHPQGGPISLGDPTSPIPGVFSMDWGDTFVVDPPGTYQIGRLTFPNGVLPDIFNNTPLPVHTPSYIAQVSPDSTVDIPDIPEPDLLRAIVPAGLGATALRRRKLGNRRVIQHLTPMSSVARQEKAEIMPRTNPIAATSGFPCWRSVARRRTCSLVEALESRRLLSFAASFPGSPTFTQRTDVNASNPTGQEAPGHEAETLVVINPTNPQNVVAFSIDFPDGSPGGVPIFPIKARYSFDGGLSYDVSDIAYPSGHTGSFDPAAVFDRAGNLYYVHLTTTATTDNVSIAKSTDSGQNWGLPTVVASVPIANDVDKCWITLGPNPDNLSEDIVYVFYLAPGQPAGLRCARSLNGGVSFSDDVLVTPLNPTAHPHFPHPIARADGRLFVAWHDDTAGAIRLAYSDNGGLTWPLNQVFNVGATTVNGLLPIPAAPGRKLFATPSVALVESGPHAGRVLVSYTTSANGLPDTDITIAFTDNLAIPRNAPPPAPFTWESITVHANPKSQFHSWIDVDPMTGVPYVNWLDCRDDAQNLHAKRFASASIDGGQTWLNPVQISDGASFPNLTFSYGDYNANDAFGGMVFDAWPDNSSGSVDSDLFTDRAILTGHVITVTGTSGPDTYHVEMDPSGEFVKVWENTDPVGTPDFIMHKDALKGLIFDLGAGVDVIFVAPEVLDYLSDPGKFLDAGDNYMIVDYTGPSSPIVSLQSLLKSGRNNGTWDGNGIRSAAAANDPNDETALGYAEATDLFTTFPATFAGQSVNNTSILIKYTYYGDTDLNGNVNLTDFNRLAANFGMTGQHWFDGDFNYDTLVNLADFNLLAGNFGQFGLGPGGGGGTYGYTVWDLRYHLLHGGHGLHP